MSLGEKVKLRLKRTGLTQQDLVRRTGLNKGTISRIVNDRADPQASTLQRIAHAIEMSVSDLYPGYPEGEARGAFVVADPEEKPKRAVCVLLVGREVERPGARLFEHVPTRRLDAGRLKALEVTTDRFAPLARPGQFMLFSEDAHVDDGDLVFCELRDGSQHVARCRFENVARTVISLLDPVPAAEGPLVVRRPDLLSFFKIVGIKL